MWLKNYVKKEEIENSLNISTNVMLAQIQIQLVQNFFIVVDSLFLEIGSVYLADFYK